MHNYVIYVQRRGTCTSFHVQIDYVVVTVGSESSTINARYLLSLPSVLCSTSLLVFFKCNTCFWGLGRCSLSAVWDRGSKA